MLETLQPQSRRIFKLARTDPPAAAKAIGALSLDAQVALVCEAPLPRRGELLDLLPAPEQVIPLIPEAEFCFTVKALGLADAPAILEYATPEQVVACIDLDGWSGTSPDHQSLEAWFDALSRTENEAFLRSIRAIDPEILALHLRSRIDVELKPQDDDWEPADGAQTLEGQFYFTARSESDDLASIGRILHLLFDRHYWFYFRMMQSAIWELAAENEEWALRWRTGRLQDLGFPPWEESMGIYGHLRPHQLAAVPEDTRPLDLGEWKIPVWIPNLPTTGGEASSLVFQTIAQLEDSERQGCFYAFIATSNKVAVADRMILSDAEATPRAIEKAARFISDGLAFVASENELEAADVLRRVGMDRLFRVGANLKPHRAEAGLNPR